MPSKQTTQTAGEDLGTGLSVQKLNESFSVIDGPTQKLKEIFDYLKVERPGAWFEPLVKSGFQSPYEHYAVIHDKKLVIMNGHRDLLGPFGVPPEERSSGVTDKDVEDFLEDVRKDLPFPPRDYQETAFRESLKAGKQICKMCTSSGKSMTIALIAEFFRRKGMRGLLLVPNINLLTQFKGDIQEYGLSDLYDDTHVIGGGETIKHFDCSLTISTWQSMQDWHDDLDRLDYVITDESHRFASPQTSGIVKKTVNCKFKWGFTGTLPEDPTMKMSLIGLFGMPKTYITSSDLIDRGLATPINVNAVVFKYSQADRNLFGGAGKTYPKQLAFLKEHAGRNRFIVGLAKRLRSKGNTLVLFQHTQHGKTLFTDTMKELYPDVEVRNKDVTGKKSFEFQERHNVYFLNGEDDAKTREMTRKIIEEHDNVILFANYALLSTGVNMKRLHNMVLSSPLKAYTTVTQSIGRGMRLHPSKSEFNVFDLVDDMGVRKPGGIFYKQYKHRVKTSYSPEGLPVVEKEVMISSFDDF